MIICDYREPTAIVEKLKKKGIEVTVESLPIGDYILPNDVVVERKERDILSSIQNGSIFNQMKNMCEYDTRILVHISSDVYKDFYHSRGKWIDKSYKGFVASALIDFGISVVIVPDENFFVDMLASMYKHLTEDKKGSLPIAKPKKGISIERRRAMALAYAVHGLGYNTASVLLKKYGSIVNIGQQTEKELLSNDGVGKTTVARIKEVLN